jgi:uncharacterized membrane protein YhdT
MNLMIKDKRAEEHTYVEDPRYKQCNSEALMGAGLGLLNLIWWFGWGYGLGSGSPSDYTYIMGFPAWFFMSSIVGSGTIHGCWLFSWSASFSGTLPLGKIDTREAEDIQKKLES